MPNNLFVLYTTYIRMLCALFAQKSRCAFENTRVKEGALARLMARTRSCLSKPAMFKQCPGQRGGLSADWLDSLNNRTTQKVDSEVSRSVRAVFSRSIASSAFAVLCSSGFESHFEVWRRTINAHYSVHLKYPHALLPIGPTDAF